MPWLTKDYNIIAIIIPQSIVRCSTLECLLGIMNSILLFSNDCPLYIFLYDRFSAQDVVTHEQHMYATLYQKYLILQYLSMHTAYTIAWQIKEYNHVLFTALFRNKCLCIFIKYVPKLCFLSKRYKKSIVTLLGAAFFE